MRRSLKTALAGVTSALLLALLLIGRAVPATAGAARFVLEGARAAGRPSARGVVWQSAEPGRGTSTPAPVGFRESGSRGLLVRAWVNGAGPFSFGMFGPSSRTITSKPASASLSAQTPPPAPEPTTQKSGINVHSSVRFLPSMILPGIF